MFDGTWDCCGMSVYLYRSSEHYEYSMSGTKIPREQPYVFFGSFLIINIRSHVRNNKPIKFYAYIMSPNLTPTPNLHKVQSVYNNNVAS